METRAAIMMTDIVGFTQLTRNESNVVGEIAHKHKEVLHELVSQYQGEIKNLFGDSSMALFEDPVAAVKCALDIQHSMQKDPLIPLRIALHIGIILLEGEEVYGDAINITARILKVATASSILISDNMEEEIRAESTLDLRSLGLFNLKYTDRQVEIFGINHTGLVLPERSDPDRKETMHINSIAVLPLMYLGKEKNQEYMGEGISEAIIHSLTKLSGVFVTSRTSSFFFKESYRDIREIGRQLNVAHVLEGSYQLDQNRLRITVQLVDTHTGYHILSETFDRELLDIFAIQEEIAWMLARRLKTKIDQQEKSQLIQPKTANVKAIDLYMQARYSLAKPSKDDIRMGIELFRRSMEEDPSFVLPYTGISTCYLYLGALRHMEEQAAYQKANEYALKALHIDPELPEAMIVHALCTFWTSNWNLKSMEEIISRALRVAPGASEIRLFRGMFILMSGCTEEALVEILLANKLDPLNPNILSRLAYTYLCIKDFEEAHTCFRLAHNTAPFAMYFNYMLAWSYLLQQKYELAESALQEVDVDVDVYQSTYGTLGFLYARQGKLDKAYKQIEVIGQMKEKGNLKYPNYNYALVYAGMKKSDEMFFHLERAFPEKPVHLMFIQADPFWEEFRSDHRYKQMVSRIFKKTSTSVDLILQSDTRERLKIRQDYLLYIKAEDNYSRIVCQDGNTRTEKVLRCTLQNLENQITDSEIIRCHRSYLVNLGRYKLAGDSKGYRLLNASDPLEIPVSRQRSKIIVKRLEENS